MKISKTKDTNFKKINQELSLSGRVLAVSKESISNVLNENEEEKNERKQVHPQMYLKRKEKLEWNRLSPRKKEKYLKAGRRATYFKKSGLQEDVKEKEAYRYIKGRHKKENTSTTGVKQRGKEGVRQTAGSAASGVLVAAEQTKKTADKFKEALQSKNLQAKMEEIREENKSKDSFTTIGKYMGATVGLVVAPVISAITVTAVTFVSSILAMLVPVIAVLVAVTVVVSLISTLLFGIEDAREAAQGYFGAKWYWIEYETGKTDDTAFATVLGDNGRAFGLQFDYAYSLQDFLQYCYNDNPIAYAVFKPYLTVNKNVLRGNQGLADAWISVFNNNKADFIRKQKEFADSRYYVPAEKRLEKAGIKIKERSEVCKGAVLSFVFQGCWMGIDNAVKGAGITNRSSDKEFIKKLYDYRMREYPRFRKRYINEKQTALDLLSGNVIVGDGYLCNPCPEAWISSEYGPRKAPTPGASTFHRGRDYAAPSGTPIYAAQSGRVQLVDNNGIRGNYLIINHGNGMQTWYQHCSKVLVRQNMTVKKGDKIATVGMTGISTGAHLHFEVHVNGEAVDPRNYLE